MLLHRKTLGVSKLRLLPKSNGVRPIMKLGSKVKLPVSLPGRQVQVSVNYQLQNALHILRYEKVCVCVCVCGWNKVLPDTIPFNFRFCQASTFLYRICDIVYIFTGQET